MLEQFDFAVERVQYISAAVERIAGFAPDGLSAAEIDAMVATAEAVRTDEYVPKHAALTDGRSLYRAAVEAGHAMAMAVYASMKSRYRKDAASRESIERLPVQDQTAAETVKRMEQMAACWRKLPLPPGAPVPPGPGPNFYVPYAGMTITVFETALEEIRTRRAAFPDTDQDFQKAEAQLHTQQALLEDFATAALEQGRAQFPSGEEREILDAVPDAPATHIPGKGEITLRSSPGAGAVKLKFDAAHATRFDVLHAEPESSDYVVVASDLRLRIYEATGLAAGQHRYEVVGRNAMGDGPVSDPAQVDVG